MKPSDLIGKTIASAETMKRPGFDDSGWLRLAFTDGTIAVVVARYGDWTGDSEDEYPTSIYITADDRGLVPRS